MTQSVEIATHCGRCGSPLSPADLACPACGLLVHAGRLHELSREALLLEGRDAFAAAQIWEQGLSLLPPDSPQALQVRERIAALQSGVFAPPHSGDTWGVAIARTGGSMLVSMLVYAFFLGPEFAVGFVLLIWIHEMGHVLALARYGVRSRAPLFIPFVGAVITIGRLRNAAEEAIVGIGGPVTGTLGALLCFTLYRLLQRDILLELSFWGFAINLLNLLPIPPLDGGRVTAAVSPWIWPLGLLGLVGLTVREYMAAGNSISGVSPVLVLILFIAVPRLWRTFRYRERDSAYYNIPKSMSWGIGISYLLLATLLVSMFYYTKSLGGDLNATAPQPPAQQAPSATA